MKKVIMVCDSLSSLGMLVNCSSLHVATGRLGVKRPIDESSLK